MRTAYIVDACRTPIGRIKGALAKRRPDDLTAEVIQALAARNPSLAVDEIDDVYWGGANQAGDDNRNVARMGVLLAGLPVSVPGATVNRLCGSGLEAVVSAARAIVSGEAEICLAGGTESMTRAPFVVPRSDQPFARDLQTFDTRLGWRMVNPRMEELYPPIPLGMTAERVAEEYGVSRERQDEFALRSHRNAVTARAAGRFSDELVLLAELDHDESVRADITAEELAAMAPAFTAGGSVTGGNSSPLNDGASGLLLMSEAAVKRLGMEPLARYVGGAAAGVHPDVMGIGPIPSSRKVLDRVGWTTEDIDLVEINEAFAAQAVAVVDGLKLDPNQVNVNGGAVALGHPLGCSGARILTTLVHELRRADAERGLATMCIGVGQGISVLVERP
jgi:acetyl-CoA acyltransferase